MLLIMPFVSDVIRNGCLFLATPKPLILARTTLDCSVENMSATWSSATPKPTPTKTSPKPSRLGSIPRAVGKRKYRDWPALRKLEYLDALMASLGSKPAPIQNKRQVAPLSTLRGSLAAHYRSKKQKFKIDEHQVLDDDLRSLFPKRTGERADQLLRRSRSRLRRRVARWTGLKQYTVDQLILLWIERARELELRGGGAELENRAGHCSDRTYIHLRSRRSASSHSLTKAPYMRKLKVLAVIHRELMPSRDPSDYHINVDWKMEYDVLETLENLNHDVERLGMERELSAFQRAYDRFRPDIVFNLLEDFDDQPAKDVHWAGLLDLMRIPYTGCGPRGLLLARDKALSKRIVRDHGVAVPRFEVYPLGGGSVRADESLFPAIVKSQTHDGSVGISQKSVVHSRAALSTRVQHIHDLVGSSAIAEQFIEGRELYVGVLGNQTLRTLPVWELSFKKRPASTRLIATDKVKWSDRYQKKVGVHSGLAKLAPRDKKRVRSLARSIYRWLGMDGYARMDFRLAPDGTLFFLEANPNPQLAYGEDFAESAEKSGISYEGLIARILALGLERG